MKRIAIGALCVSVVVVAGVLLRDTIPAADAWLLEHAYFAPGTLGADVVTAISGGATLVCLAALLAGTVVAWRRRGAGLVLRALSVGALGVSVLLLQPVMLRPGPPLQPQAGTYPSGHATIVTAIAVTAVVLLGSLGRAWRGPVEGAYSARSG